MRPVTVAQPEPVWGAPALSPGTTDSISPVFICVLGTFRVLKGGQPVPLRSGGKTQALLLTLSVCDGYCASRGALLEALWPGNHENLSRQSLNTLVHSLRRSLGDAIGGAAPVVHSDGYYRLNVEAGVTVDVGCFDSLARAGERKARAGDIAGAVATYGEALRLYRGDLCVAGDSRAVVERERVRTLYLKLLGHLADYYYSLGNYDACLKTTLDLLAHDPCREDGHRIAMRCYIRRGERAQALRQFQMCRSILLEEFTATPEPATTALYEKVRLSPEDV
jgi:DNA-binding SARP family transcriptional activator